MFEVKGVPDVGDIVIIRPETVDVNNIKYPGVVKKYLKKFSKNNNVCISVNDETKKIAIYYKKGFLGRKTLPYISAVLNYGVVRNIAKLGGYTIYEVEQVNESPYDTIPPNGTFRIDNDLMVYIYDVVGNLMPYKYSFFEMIKNGKPFKLIEYSIDEKNTKMTIDHYGSIFDISVDTRKVISILLDGYYLRYYDSLNEYYEENFKKFLIKVKDTVNKIVKQIFEELIVPYVNENFDTLLNSQYELGEHYNRLRVLLQERYGIYVLEHARLYNIIMDKFFEYLANEILKRRPVPEVRAISDFAWEITRYGVISSIVMKLGFRGTNAMYELYDILSKCTEPFLFTEQRCPTYSNKISQLAGELRKTIKEGIKHALRTMIH